MAERKLVCARVWTKRRGNVARRWKIPRQKIQSDDRYGRDRKDSGQMVMAADAAVRGVLLEFDTLPADSEEASGVVRFRMKKSLPFDVDKARVSYHAQKTNEGVRVVAAVALASVLEERVADDPDLKDVPVFLMSSVPEAAVRDKCSGYALFIRKPFEIYGVINLVTRALKPPEIA